MIMLTSMKKVVGVEVEVETGVGAEKVGVALRGMLVIELVAEIGDNRVNLR